VQRNEKEAKSNQAKSKILFIVMLCYGVYNCESFINLNLMVKNRKISIERYFLSGRSVPNYCGLSTKIINLLIT
jgi:hypothetical protein